MVQQQVGFAEFNPPYGLLADRILKRAELRPFNSTTTAHAQPVATVVSIAHETAKCRVGPLMRTPGHSVLDRVVVDVVTQPFIFSLVSYAMLPESPVPHSTLRVTKARSASPGFATTTAQESGREIALDQAPTRRVVVISVRQDPDAMEMIGQENNGIESEWPPSAHAHDRFAQCAPRNWRGQKTAGESWSQP